MQEVRCCFRTWRFGRADGHSLPVLPRGKLAPVYRRALEQVTDTGTAVTNLFSGRPARGILNRYLKETGLMSEVPLAFPYAATLVAPLRAASGKTGSLDYMQLGAGQAAGLVTAMPADQFIRKLAEDALSRFPTGV
jgi:nitronate monooxygenase